MAPVQSRFPLLGLLLLLAIAAGVYSLSLGRRDLWAPDEPKYALTAREMVQTGDFLLPHLNGEVYPDKPPLFFWAIAAAGFFTGGVNQTAAVLPSLLAALATLAGVAWLVWLLTGRTNRRAPVLAAGLLGISYAFVAQSTQGQIDMLLTACTTWAFVCLVTAADFAEGTAPQARYALAAFALMGLGTLAKGPVALAVPLGGFIVGAWLADRKVPWRTLLRPAAWLIYLGIVAAWLIPAAIHAGNIGEQHWLTNILFRQMAERYAASWHHFQPFYYFLYVPLYHFQPAVALLPGAIWQLVRRRAQEEVRPRAQWLLAGACLFALVFFSVPRGKRDLYLLPIYPLAAAWFALDLDARLVRGGAALRWPRMAAAVIGVIALAACVATLYWAPDALLARQVAFDTTLPALALAAIALTALGLSLVEHPRLLLPAHALAWAGLYAALLFVAVPVIDRVRSARLFIDEVRQHVVPEAKPGMVDFRAQYGFYAGHMETADPGDKPALRRLAAHLQSTDPIYVLVTPGDWPRLKRQMEPGPAPCKIYEREIGGDKLLVLTNAAATRR